MLVEILILDVWNKRFADAVSSISPGNGLAVSLHFLFFTVAFMVSISFHFIACRFNKAAFWIEFCLSNNAHYASYFAVIYVVCDAGNKRSSCSFSETI